MAQLEKLIDLLATHGGRIISTGSLEVHEIQQASAADRMFVDQNGFGFVWDPEIKEFPTTDEKMELFEKWYPLDNIEVPDGLFERIMERINQEPVCCKLPGVDLIGCPLINTDCKTCKYK